MPENPRVKLQGNAQQMDPEALAAYVQQQQEQSQLVKVNVALEVLRLQPDDVLRKVAENVLHEYLDDEKAPQ